MVTHGWATYESPKPLPHLAHRRLLGLQLGSSHSTPQSPVRATLTPAALAARHTGDFVDRGSWGTELLAVLVAWKLALPSSLLLLRGNHESTTCTKMYGFHSELRGKYGAKSFQVRHPAAAARARRSSVRQLDTGPCLCTNGAVCAAMKAAQMHVQRAPTIRVPLRVCTACARRCLRRCRWER